MGDGIKEGFEGFYDLPFSEYRKQTWAVSSSDLSLLLRAPILYKHVVINGHRRSSTKSLDEGSAVHAAVLEPKIFKETYIIAPYVNKRTLKGREDLEAFQSANPDSIMVDADDHKRFLEISAVVNAHPEAKALLHGCSFEQSFFWKQRHVDLHSKARADALNMEEEYVVDLKTTRDAKNFLKSVEEYGYHRQAAYYLQGLSKLANKNIKTWYWIAVETTAPYLCRVYKASPSMLTMGALETRVLLSRLNKCNKDKSFPSLPEGIKELDLSKNYVERTRAKFTEET